MAIKCKSKMAFYKFFCGLYNITFGPFAKENTALFTPAGFCQAEMAVLIWV